MAKKLALRDMKSAYDAEFNSADHTPNVEELYQEITVWSYSSSKLVLE